MIVALILAAGAGTRFHAGNDKAERHKLLALLRGTRVIDHSIGAVRAQAEIPALNAAARGSSETYYAGAWQRYGFHEDGLLSAVRLCELLLGRDPWTV